jgi:23S rRNA (uridine2552-2'-O)-methyltransferase
MTKKKKGGTLGPGARMLTTRLKTAEGRTISSQRWLQRQLNDPYVTAAKALGYRSRAAFKLKQINERYKLLRKGMRVLDLGAAPGGWSQIAADIVGTAGERSGRVLAVDINPMDLLPGVDVMREDFLSEGAEARIEAALGGKADAVFSDMAAPSTGHRQTDHLRIMALAEAAGAFATQVLAPGGFFLCKVLQGGSERDLLTMLKKSFSAVRHVKPEASRSDSAELYVLATGFKGN